MLGKESIELDPVSLENIGDPTLSLGKSWEDAENLISQDVWISRQARKVKQYDLSIKHYCWH